MDILTLPQAYAIAKGEAHDMMTKKAIWVGYLMSAVPVLLLLFSGMMKLMKAPSVGEGFVHLGYDENISVSLGLVELLSTVLYLIPRTSVLGAILLTGYLGGATASHLRIGEPFHAAVILGILLWGGLYLRDERLRHLIPLKR
jgi:hypothetical protein